MICFLILDHVIFIILEICFLIQLRQTVHSYTRDWKFERKNAHEYRNRVIINEAKRKREYFRNSFRQFFIIIILMHDMLELGFLSREMCNLHTWSGNAF